MDENAKKLLDTLNEYNTKSLNDWLQKTQILTWHWWLGVLITIIPIDFNHIFQK